MSISLIKFLSYSIFIAEQQNNNILVLLLKDYARTRVTKMQFLFILMLIVSYRERALLIDNKLYKILFLYIDTYADSICRTLILS
ncbi:unnamed protein product [marine sediment metagenome]|uniref:Uncharacterized protein n=1 Tax=marine sediment metagenome TaxID=412755 RepID=X0Z7K6_9ZZZZ